jgi:hypothetical protein
VRHVYLQAVSGRLDVSLGRPQETRVAGRLAEGAADAEDVELHKTRLPPNARYLR